MSSSLDHIRSFCYNFNILVSNFNFDIETIDASNILENEYMIENILEQLSQIYNSHMNDEMKYLYNTCVEQYYML